MEKEEYISIALTSIAVVGIFSGSSSRSNPELLKASQFFKYTVLRYVKLMGGAWHLNDDSTITIKLPKNEKSLDWFLKFSSQYDVNRDKHEERNLKNKFYVLLVNPPFIAKRGLQNEKKQFFYSFENPYLQPKKRQNVEYRAYELAKSESE